MDLATRHRGAPAELDLHEDALLGLHALFPDKYPVLFESIGGGTLIGRYDLLLALPGERLMPDGRASPDGRRTRPSHHRFLDALDRLVANREPGARSRRSAAVRRWLVPVSRLRARRRRSSRACGCRARTAAAAMAWRMRGAIVRDCQTGRAWVVAEGEAGAALRRERRARSRPRALERHAGMRGRSTWPSRARSTRRTPHGSCECVEAALEAIRRGDVYQANLSRLWRARLAPDGNDVALYRRLREANPAPFAAIARLPGYSRAEFVARAPVAHRGRCGEHPADRGHAPARGRRRDGREAALGPAAERKGAGRARDARRPRAQRPGADLPCGDGAGRRVHERSRAMHTCTTSSRTCAASSPTE